MIHGFVLKARKGIFVLCLSMNRVGDDNVEAIDAASNMDANADSNVDAVSDTEVDVDVTCLAVLTNCGKAILNDGFNDIDNANMNAGFNKIGSSDNGKNTVVDDVAAVVFLSDNADNAKAVDAAFKVDANANGDFDDNSGIDNVMTK